jgi:hypothetical protein
MPCLEPFVSLASGESAKASLFESLRVAVMFDTKTVGAVTVAVTVTAGAAVRESSLRSESLLTTLDCHTTSSAGKQKVCSGRGRETASRSSSGAACVTGKQR